MKKLFCTIIVLIMIMFTMSTAFAYKGSAEFSSSNFTHEFQTTDYLSKATSETWSTITNIYVGSITGVISAQPINELGQAIGAAMTFSSAGTKYSHMTNQNCNTVHLLIKNKTSGGGTAAVSGRFYNTAS
ncbi:MAG: hypothetical protein PUC54_07645 [Clostridiales bacterium]|nr:hypothetical protein [Clostridiales bacterium]